MLIIINSLDPEVEGRESNINYWEELLCGVYSIDIDASRAGACLSGKVRKHEGMNSMLKDLIAWERKLIEPKHVELKTFSSSLLLGKPDLLSASDSGTLRSSTISPAERVLGALRKSITQHTTQNAIF
ncbi:uncharacterized protein LOC130591701 [Beta vulgaris subsp. vulgaris]|uniref:uncharacterized protein LOC130591701 n=1 Tax=Beta vulgaris subsp. vulgaris TaxID=3555 RepID=UPI002546A5F5|nr:uncharacterized protein LOC130591701 [Beta vulgaris subsp. vulgaris]